MKKRTLIEVYGPSKPTSGIKISRDDLRFLNFAFYTVAAMFAVLIALSWISGSTSGRIGTPFAVVAVIIGFKYVRRINIKSKTICWDVTVVGTYKELNAGEIITIASIMFENGHIETGIKCPEGTEPGTKAYYFEEITSADNRHCRPFLLIKNMKNEEN